MKEILESGAVVALFCMATFVLGMIVGGTIIGSGVKDDCRLLKQYRYGDRFAMTCEVVKDDK